MIPIPQDTFTWLATTFTMLFLIFMLLHFAYKRLMIAKHQQSLAKRITHILSLSLFKIDDSKSTLTNLKRKRRKKIWQTTKLVIWFTIIMSFMLTVTFLLTFSTTAILISLIFYLIGLLAIYVVMTNLKARQEKKFIEQLPDAMDLMARAVSAGHSVSETISIVADNFSGMIGDEFRLIADSLNVGNTLEEALDDAAENLNISEFRFFSIIVNVQQQTGGNIVKLLNDLSETLRKKRATAQRIAALSAEPIASAVIIGIIPFLIVVILSILSPNYISPLIVTETGHMIIGGSIVAQILGMLVMRKIIRIDI